MTDTLTDRLTILAQSMESLRPAGSQPAWAEIEGPLEDPERVQWHPDVETLVGHVAPPGCTAIATVGYGTAFSLEEARPSAGAPLNPGERRRVRVVCLMTRSGELAGYLRAGPVILIDEPPTVGRIIDCIRRSFGLPTPAPEEPTDRLLAHMWLNTVVSVGERTERPLTWPQAARLHPAMQVATEAGVAIPLSQLVGMLRAASDTWNWEYLVQQAAQPGWLADFLPPGAGGWMDEGILSRWLFMTFGDIDPLLERAAAVLAPSGAKNLRNTLRQLGVVGGRHPHSYRVSKS